MSVIADEVHSTRVIVVVKCYLSYCISTCSAGVAGGTPVRKYALVVPRMAITYTLPYVLHYSQIVLIGIHNPVYQEPSQRLTTPSHLQIS